MPLNVTQKYQGNARISLCSVLFQASRHKSGIWVLCWARKEPVPQGQSQQELERMNKLRAYCAACPVRGADQGQGWKKEQAQSNALGTHWECACRGAGKTAIGRAPVREEAEGKLGAKSPYKGTRGRGGGTFLTNPQWPKEDGGKEKAPSLWNAERLWLYSRWTARKMAVGFAFSPHCSDIPALISDTTMAKHSKSVFTVHAYMAEDSSLCL